MGTRADFYVGDGVEAEWLGSIAYDGYHLHGADLSGEDGPNWDDCDRAIAMAQTPEAYREAVAAFLAKRSDATLPSQGWPWPWADSQTTDYAYCFVGGEVVSYCFGQGPVRLGERHFDQPGESSHGPKKPFPDMTARQNVTFGRRSGLIILGINPSA